jgi:hypothetical protein
MSFEDQITYLNRVLEIQFSEDFIRKKKARVFVGYHRYGPNTQYAQKKLEYKILDTVRKRLDEYERTGNQEHLVDAANYLMIEYKAPQHPNAHFESIEEEDASKRLGIVRETETLLRLDDENHKKINGDLR